MREYIAIAAMTGVVSNNKLLDMLMDQKDKDIIYKTAFTMADEMLKYMENENK